MIYLDHNAITPVRPEAAAAVARSLSAFGNPSSVHAAGREARALLDESRARVAAPLGVAPRDLVFTSGATEAINLALQGAASRHGIRDERPGRILTLVTEHPAVLDTLDHLARRGSPAHNNDHQARGSE